MNKTVSVLRAEAARLRALADQMETLIRSIEGEELAGAIGGGNGTLPVARPDQGAHPKKGEFSGLKQTDAILRALKYYGPQTTRELFTRLNSGGMSFRQVSYVTAVLSRIKDSVERQADGKLKLKPNKEVESRATP